jgi:hypothetical protein
VKVHLQPRHRLKKNKNLIKSVWFFKFDHPFVELVVIWLDLFFKLAICYIIFMVLIILTSFIKKKYVIFFLSSCLVAKNNII